LKNEIQKLIILSISIHHVCIFLVDVLRTKQNVVNGTSLYYRISLPQLLLPSINLRRRSELKNFVTATLGSRPTLLREI